MKNVFTASAAFSTLPEACPRQVGCQVAITVSTVCVLLQKHNAVQISEHGEGRSGERRQRRESGRRTMKGGMTRQGKDDVGWGAKTRQGRQLPEVTGSKLRRLRAQALFT